MPTMGMSASGDKADIPGGTNVNMSSAAARFSCRWAIDEVPGIKGILGARWSSQARPLLGQLFLPHYLFK
jgi:hypothetical protein